VRKTDLLSALSFHGLPRQSLSWLPSATRLRNGWIQAAVPESLVT
jgi:hypothetical protein